MKQAFTLVELLVVIIIVAVLAAVAIPKFQNAGQQGKESSAKADLKVLRSAVERFQADMSAYPASFDGLVSQSRPANGKQFYSGDWHVVALAATWSGPYVLKSPICPLSGYAYQLDWGATGVLRVTIGSAADASNPYRNW